MNTTILRRIVGALLFVAALATSSACLAPYDIAGVSVSVGPPPLRFEARSNYPGSGYVWISGYWDWGGGSWDWVPGAWVRSPRPRAAWVAPSYHHRRGHWYYNRGHWR